MLVDVMGERRNDPASIPAALQTQVAVLREAIDTL